MAFFIPSYFQKRLLRYALTRLDLIETDALNLEDLDITFGQTSVVELKNVGIKVAKLIDKLQLPPTSVLDHAIIRRLRITLPANLYTNGIAVEVDGVDISVELREGTTNTSVHGQRASSHRDVTKYPRDPLSTQHSSGEKGSTGGSDSEHVMPTSRDLAMSFLETEPLQEKEELEAAIQTRSQYVQESTASLSSSTDELGTGMPGGFSLPGFVANFFAGIADRLSVAVTNVDVSVGLALTSGDAPADNIKAVLRIAKLTLAALGTPAQSGLEATSQRQILLTGFEVLLLSEPEVFSQSSAVSSPRLLKSRSKASSSLSSENMSQFESPESRLSDIEFQPALLAASGHGGQDPDISSSTASISSSTPRSVRLLSEAGDSQLRGSRFPIRSDPQDSEFRHEKLDHSSHSADVEKNVNTHIEDDPISTLEGGSRTPSDAALDDLTQSRIYTHDQAESMYLSAISENPAAHMPGGWESSEYRMNHDDAVVMGSHSPQTDPTLSTQQHHSEVALPISRVAPPLGGGASDMSTSIATETRFESDRLSTIRPNLIAKRLVLVSEIKLIIPASKAQDSVDISPSIPRETSVSRTDVQKSASRYELITSSVSIALDISISKILIRAATAMQKILPLTDSKPRGSQSSLDLHLSTRLQSFVLNMCQVVPEVPDHLSRSTIDMKAHQQATTQVLMLQLNLSNLEYQMTRQSSGTQQKIKVGKILLGRGAENFMYFVDSINVRDSLATSTMLRPYDLLITNIDDRYVVQLKPAHITVDLLSVDDILSRGGGLSSLIDLGNSVLSTGTIKDRPSVPSRTSTRPRTIRFDSTSVTTTPDAESSVTGPKIDIRISGAFINLVGSESSIQLTTSAIKLVSRQKVFRVQIDNAALVGPIVKGTKENADINIKLTKLSLLYLDTPTEEDLDRLLSLLTPSSDKYDKEDDIMVDTLISQRRKGGVMRLEAGDGSVGIKGLDWQKRITTLGDELARLAAVSKYLPEDDRPGVLTFGLVKKFLIKAEIDQKLGTLTLDLGLLETAHISVPSLMAAQLSSILVKQNGKVLITDVIPNLQDSVIMGPPMLMCRFIADEMEPTVRVKLSNTQLEYSVPALIAITDLADSLKKEQADHKEVLSPRSSVLSSSQSDMSDFSRRVRFSLAVRNSSVALNPDKSAARGLLLLSDMSFNYASKKSLSIAQLDLRKAEFLIIDDAEKIGHGHLNADHRLYFEQNDQIQDLTKAGYVPVAFISNASAVVKVVDDDMSDQPLVDVELRNNLFLLETCADSTQTLIQILSGLAPPSAPSPQAKYRTEVVPIQDMLASFTGDAFVSEQGPELGMHVSHMTENTSTAISDDDNHESEHDDDGDDYSDEGESYDEEDEEQYRSELADSYVESELSRSRMSDSVHIAPVNPTADNISSEGDSVMAHSKLDFRTDHFAPKTGQAALPRHWNSAQNSFGSNDKDPAPRLPFRLQVRDVHIIWNLFDGFDWQSTRDTISQAVQEIEAKATLKRAYRGASAGREDDESIVGDFLFNSIYIGIPANKDPRGLTDAVNQELGDGASETGSYATGTTITALPSNRSGASRPKQKKLRLDRSKRHKLTFELRGVSADVIALPPGTSEVEHSIDIRVNMLEIFDHLSTSTWNKFVTYMHEAGEREVNTSMIHIEMLNVRPVADLAASEFVMKLSVLPLRLHIDQDALDFMTRFFEFKDDKASSSSSGTSPFFQRVEVNPVKLKLDFKPKRVDYSALRAGRTTEFMNFIVLERTDILLRRVILYGVSGLDRVGIMLNNIWSPDVKKNQLPGVLSGLAPIRSLVDVGSGIKDLVAVPIREYKKDGRIVRSIQKGALAFAKTTTTELVNLGAKLAVGTQTVLQNAEEVLVPRPKSDDDDEPKEQISLYADQPLGIVQGLRGAYASLERDLLLAKDAIVAVPGEVMASGSATDAAKAVLRQTPIIILRPAIGATKAVGQTLLGAGNTLDKGKMRRVEEKYKRRF